MCLGVFIYFFLQNSVVERHFGNPRRDPLTRSRILKLQRSLLPDQAILIYDDVRNERVCVALTRSARCIVPVGPVPASAQTQSLPTVVWDHEAQTHARESLLRPLKALPPVKHLFIILGPDDLVEFPFAVVAQGQSISYGTPYILDRVLEPGTRAPGRGVLALGSASSEVGLQSVAKLDKWAGAETVRREVEGRRWRAVHICGPFDRQQCVFATTDAQRRVRTSDLLRADTELLVLSSSETAFGVDASSRGGPFDSLGWTNVFEALGGPDGPSVYAECVDLTEAAEGGGMPTRGLLVSRTCRFCLVHVWRKDEAASRALLRAFYKNWEPRDPRDIVAAAQALREAQEEVRSQTDWRHPYYWAGWQLWSVSP